MTNRQKVILLVLGSLVLYPPIGITVLLTLILAFLVFVVFACIYGFWAGI